MFVRRWNHSVIRTSALETGAQACGIAHSVISMDRLLHYFLDHFIRRGAMTFTTASGAKFTCGDGSGEPVAARFLTADAERRILLNPELGLGEAYMDGTFVVERGSIADALAILLEATMRIPLASRAQVRILSEGIVEALPACAALPEDLMPSTRFTDEQIRQGLPQPGAFKTKDLRCCS